MALISIWREFCERKHCGEGEGSDVKGSGVEALLPEQRHLQWASGVLLYHLYAGWFVPEEVYDILPAQGGNWT